MPVRVEKRSCTKADGTKGDWAVVNENTGRVESCHDTETDAQVSKRIREQSKD